MHAIAGEQLNTFDVVGQSPGATGRAEAQRGGNVTGTDKPISIVIMDGVLAIGFFWNLFRALLPATPEQRIVYLLWVLVCNALFTGDNW